MIVESDFEVLIQILFIGDIKVGKTSIILKYCENLFDDHLFGTSGLDIRTKIEKINNKRVKVQLWDTPGQNRYRSLPKQLLNKVQGLVLVYSVTEEDTYKNCEGWINSIKENTDDIPLLIIGNKMDLEEERVVSQNEGKTLADENSAIFIETSAKTGININEGINMLADKILKKSVQQNLNFSLDSSMVCQSKKNCCGENVD